MAVESPARTESLPRIARTPFYYGWVILAVAALANFTSAPGQTYTFSVFLDSFTEDLGLSSTLVATLYLGGSLTAAGMMVFVGRSLDRFGPRVMLAFAALCLGLGALWMWQVTEVWQLYAGFAVMRTMGQGALSLIPATMVSVWFIRKRAKALALMALGGAAASGLFPVYASALSESFGWRTAWVAIAFTTWGLLIVPALLLARRSPESVGLQPDGAKRGRADIPAAAVKNADSQHHWTMSEAVRSRALWLLILAGSAQSLVGTGVMFHQVELMTGKGLSASAAAGVFVVIAPMLIIGQFLAGFLADRFAERHLLAAGQGFIVLIMLFLLTVSEPWQAYAYGAMLGLNMGFLMNSMQSIWPSYFGRAHLGSIRGVTNLGMMAAAALGPLPLSASLDATGSYTAGIIAYMCLPPVCGLAALLAGRPGPPPAGGTEATATRQGSAP